MSTNHYKDMLPRVFYNACPKAIFAALAVEFCHIHVYPNGIPPYLSQEEYYKELSEAFLKTWYRLHLDGLIPHPPPKKLWPKPPLKIPD